MGYLKWVSSVEVTESTRFRTSQRWRLSGRSIVDVWLGGTVLNGLLLGSEIVIGCVVFGG